MGNVSKKESKLNTLCTKRLFLFYWTLYHLTDKTYLYFKNNALKENNVMTKNVFFLVLTFSTKIYRAVMSTIWCRHYAVGAMHVRKLFFLIFFLKIFISVVHNFLRLTQNLSTRGCSTTLRTVRQRPTTTPVLFFMTLTWSQKMTRLCIIA